MLSEAATLQFREARYWVKKSWYGNMLFKKLNCFGPTPHRVRTDDWWLIWKQEKREAFGGGGGGREKGEEGGREMISLSLDNSTSYWLVWQNGKHPMTVWGGEIKLTTELGSELTVKNSKSRITLLYPITPHAVHLGLITHHAGVLSRVTETPFTTLIFRMLGSFVW